MKIKLHNVQHEDLGELPVTIENLFRYFKSRLSFKEDPTIKLISDPDNSSEMFGDTGAYNPHSLEIMVFINGRHPKDILRSIAHELYHHYQNVNLDSFGGHALLGAGEEGYAQKNPMLREIEKEAYKTGNILFRDWTDHVKYGTDYRQYLSEQKNYGLIKKLGYKL